MRKPRASLMTCGAICLLALSGCAGQPLISVTCPQYPLPPESMLVPVPVQPTMREKLDRILAEGSMPLPTSATTP